MTSDKCTKDDAKRDLITVKKDDLKILLILCTSTILLTIHYPSIACLSGVIVIIFHAYHSFHLSKKEIIFIIIASTFAGIVTPFILSWFLIGRIF